MPASGGWKSSGLISFLAASLVLGIPTSQVRAQALPEGDTGIAARYINDEGIADSPQVVFADNFESLTETNLSAENSAWDNAWGEIVVVKSAATVHAGAQAIQITHTDNNSIGAWRDFGDGGFDTLHVRYYMKYHADFPGCHHTGMSLLAAAPGLDQGSSTGVRPTGTNHYQVLLDNIAPFFDWGPPGNIAPGMTALYTYHMDQAGDYGDHFFPSGDSLPGGRDLFGDSFEPRTDFTLERDRWYSFELMMSANTVGQQNGRIAFWIDGKLSGDFPNLRLRDIETLKTNFVVLTTYSSQRHDNKVLWYDDVVVATEYIGPMVTDSPPTEDSGSSLNSDVGPGDTMVRDSHPTAHPSEDGGADSNLDSDAGGCACRVAGKREQALSWWLLGIFGLLRARRRRSP